MKEFEDLKSGDVLYEKYNGYFMEAWWVVIDFVNPPNEFESPYWNAKLIHQNKDEDVTNSYCNYRLYKDNYTGNYVGTKEDFPEYFL